MTCLDDGCEYEHVSAELIDPDPFEPARVRFRCVFRCKVCGGTIERNVVKPLHGVTCTCKTCTALLVAENGKAKP